MKTKAVLAVVLVVVSSLLLGSCAAGISQEDYYAVIAEWDAAQEQVANLQSDYISLQALRAVTLTRGPYLQSVTPTSILVAWETDKPADSVIEYGLTAEYGSIARDTALVTRHVIALDGLSPYTTYHYRVGTTACALSGDSSFKLAAVPEQKSFTFVAFGDTRTNVAAHQSVIDVILTVDPDFYLHTGDLVGDGSQLDQWNSFFQIEGDLMRNTALFPSLGNHEHDHLNYFDLFYLPHNERWYSFDYGHAHFICLQVDGFANHSPGSEQYLWLEYDLAHNDQPWAFVFFHIPPYSSGPHGSDLGVQAA